MIHCFIMDREFERFRGGANEPLSKRLHVTLHKTKAIVLNRNTYKMMGSPEAVFLSYSRQRDLIAIEPTSLRSNDAFPLVVCGAGYRINSGPFCSHFNISTNTTLKFIAPEVTGDALYLNLGDTVEIHRRKRTLKK